MRTLTSLRSLALFGVVAALAGCASVPEPPAVHSGPVSSSAALAAQRDARQPEQPRLRHRIAVGRFTNSTRYGRALLRPGERDPLADQVADMLTTRLIETGKFLVFERQDLAGIEQEQALSETASENRLVGVEALVLGSVTEFGRRTEGQAGFLSSTLRQAVDARVEMRLVDVGTGLAFFSGQGTGSATNEAGEVAGFGSRAGYDGSLNDRAIAAAVDDLINNIIQEFEGRSWKSDLLGAEGGLVYFAGGSAAGINVGDRFVIERRGETVRSRQTGLPITLPGQIVAEVEVVDFFGEDEFSEGSMARLISGSIPDEDTWNSLDVREATQ